MLFSFIYIKYIVLFTNNATAKLKGLEADQLPFDNYTDPASIIKKEKAPRFVYVTALTIAPKTSQPMLI
jgi:hypothetical protein